MGEDEMKDGLKLGESDGASVGDGKMDGNPKLQVPRQMVTSA